MKIIKSEVSFKSDVALVVVGQDTNSPSNAAPRDLQGEVQLFQVVLTAGQFLSLVLGGGSCSNANRPSSFYLGQLISCRLLTILNNQML